MLFGLGWDCSEMCVDDKVKLYELLIFQALGQLQVRIILDELSQQFRNELVVPRKTAHEDEDMFECYPFILLLEVGVQGCPNTQVSYFVPM